MLDEPTNKDYVYNYRDGSNIKFKGTPLMTVDEVLVTGQILDKIGLFTTTKYGEKYDRI